MKTCPKCGTSHEQNGKFCSRKCANARVWSAETNARRSASITATKALIPQEIKKTWSQTQAAKIREAGKVKRAARDTVGMSYTALRKKLLEECNNTCDWCHNSEWRGQPITIEIDHIDGNNKNNERSNLRCLCPNCHSQTPTWRGRDRVERAKRKRLTQTA